MSCHLNKNRNMTRHSEKGHCCDPPHYNVHVEIFTMTGLFCLVHPGNMQQSIDTSHSLCGFFKREALTHFL